MGRIHQGRFAKPPKQKSIVTITRGGTDASLVEDAISNLGGINVSEIGQPNGLILLNSQNKIPLGNLPIDATTGSTISGPNSLNLGEVANYTITNYNTFIDYTITAISGSVSVSGDTITYTAPLLNTQAGFIVNGVTYDIGISVALNTDTMNEYKITAIDKAFNDEFGYSVSVDSSGTRVAIGAYLADYDGSVVQSGKVYVFIKSGTNWVQEQILTASVKVLNDQFGQSVSISGDGTRIVVGVPLSNDVGTVDAGNVYIFSRSGTTWTEEAKLTASDKIAGDQFGYSVDIDSIGTRVVIGAYLSDPSGLSNAGKVYVFLRTGTSWTQEAILSASDKAISDFFGFTVAIDNTGTRIVIGAYQANPPSTTIAGKAYIFLRTGTSWTQEQILTASDRAINDRFGYSVDIDSTGTRCVIGAYTADPGAISDAGKAYIFSRSGTIWTQEAILSASDKVAGDQFGSSVTITELGDKVVIGSYQADPSGLTAAGKAYIFTRSGTIWSETDILSASDKAAGDLFGQSVAISGNGLVSAVGASKEESTLDANNDTGAVYIYTVGVGVPNIEEDSLVYYDAAANNSFGISISVDKTGARCIVGAHHANPTPTTGSGAAYVFIRYGNRWVLEQKLTASDATSGDDFGNSVAISGDGTRCIVGAPNANPSGISGAGKVYIFTRSGTTWTQEQILTASDRTADDYFGSAVAMNLDGSRVVIGAYSDDYSTTYTASGSIYVFSRTGTVWTQETKKTPANRSTNGYFGYSVAIDNLGTRIIAGAMNNDNGGSGGGEGEVYIFSRSGTTWSQEALLIASDSSSVDRFGSYVDITGDGTRVIIGAHSAGTGINSPGAAYVFIRLGTSWIQEAKLVAGDGLHLDGFGSTVQITDNGALCAIGAPNADVDGISNSGKIYYFIRNGNTWSEVYTLLPNIKVAGDVFGNVTSLVDNGGRLLVGIPVADVDAVTNSGYVLSYTITLDKAIVPNIEEDKLTASDKATSDVFGYSVDISGDGTRCIVGAYESSQDSVTDSGVAYIFRRVGDSWIQETKLSASDKAGGDRFGTSVAIDNTGTRVVIGADLANPASLGNAGKAYIFLRTGTTWTQEAILTASDKVSGDQFGYSAAIDNTGTRVIIGARSADPSGLTDAGKAYIFLRTGTSWTQEAILSASDKATGDAFGNSVSIDYTGTRVIIGSVQNNPSSLTDAGAAYVFLRTGTSWTQEAKLTASNKSTLDHFGVSVNIDSDGTRIVIGANNVSVSGINSAGSAYIFSRTGTVWTEEAILTASDKAASDLFGGSVAINSNGTIAAIGAYQANEVGILTDVGKVYVFLRTGTIWTEKTILLASDRAASDFFGSSLSLDDSGDRVIIGSHQSNPNGLSNAGSAYVYSNTISPPITPVITSPVTGATDINSSVTITASNFSLPLSSDTHESTDWQIASDINFNTIVVSSINDTINKTSWIADGLSPSTTYYIRVRYKATLNGYSDYSSIITVTTKDIFTPTTEEAILTASDKSTSAYLGYSVSITDGGTRVIVGAIGSNTTFSNSGAAYIFTKSGGFWTQEQKIYGTNTAGGDQFGHSVDIDSTGTRCVIGARNTDPSGISDAGSCYVFTRTGSTWTQEQILTASDGISGDNFGTSVQMNTLGDRLVISAPSAPVAGFLNRGAAYIFVRSGTTWTQETKLSASDGAAGDNFGTSVAISGDGTRVIVGARNADPSGLSNAGKAYVFLRTGTTWTQEAILTAAGKAAGDLFGISVDIDSTGSRVIVGASNTSYGVSASGVAYIFTRSGTTWTEEATLSASDKASNDLFGYSVAISLNGLVAVIGAYTADPSGILDGGKVYVFLRTGTTWTQRTILSTSNKAAGNRFGNSVSVSGDGASLIAGSPYANPASVSVAGTAYIFD